MDYILMGLAVVVIIILLSGIAAWYKNKNASVKSQRPMQPVKCPVCGSNLYVGENIISKVYRPMNVPDQLCTISGCPHCFPVCEPGLHRACPVCHKAMSQKDSLTARLFNKKLGDKHVHIIGCSNCHKPRAD